MSPGHLVTLSGKGNMPIIIALLTGLLAFVLGYNLLYRRQLTLSASAQRVEDALTVQAVQPTQADPKSPEYRLAAAGIRSGNPRLMWLLINYGPAPVLFMAALAFGLPVFVALGAALVGFIAPQQWLAGRIKDRGRRMEADLPQVYVELLSVLRANPDVAPALAEVADGLEQEKGPTPLSAELWLAAQEAASTNVGRVQAMQNLQARAASVSVANLGLLLERYAQTGSGQGASFFEAFATGAANVQSILEARQRAQSKAAESMQSARLVPLLLGVTLFFFMSDPSFRNSFQLPLVQIVLGGAVVVMYAGYLIMGDMAREAV